MGKSEQLIVGLPTDLARKVSEAVKAGEFATTSDVVVGALLAWFDRRDDLVMSDDEVIALCEAGLRSGISPHSGIETIIAEASRSGADER